MGPLTQKHTWRFHKSQDTSRIAEESQDWEGLCFIGKGAFNQLLSYSVCVHLWRLLWSVNPTKNSQSVKQGVQKPSNSNWEWFWHGLLLLCIPGSLSDDQYQICLSDMIILYHTECFCFTSRHLECVLGVIHCCGHLDCIRHK